MAVPLKVTIDGDVKDLNKKINDTEKNVSKIGTVGSKVFGTFKSAGTTAIGAISTRVKGLGTLIAGVGVGIAGLGIGVGAKTLGFANELGEAQKSIANSTGAIGKDLKDLNDSAINVFKTGDESIGDVATTLGNVNTVYGVTGQALEDLTSKFLMFTGAVGGDGGENVKTVGRLMGDWSIQTDKAGETLDKLLKASQVSGIGVDSLATTMTNAGVQMRSLGFGFDETVALLSKFEKEGVNTEAILSGLNKGVVTLAKSGGKTIPEAWKDFISTIKNTKSDTEAMNKAVDVLGAKAGPQLALAIKEGRFEIDSYINSLQGASGALAETDAAGETLTDRFNALVNQVKASLIPAITAMMPILETLVSYFTKNLSNAISYLTQVFSPFVNKFKASFNLIKETFNNSFGGFSQFIQGTLLPILNTVITSVINIGNSFIKVLPPIINLIKGTLIPALQFITPILVTIFDKVAQYLPSIVEWINDAVLKIKLFAYELGGPLLTRLTLMTGKVLEMFNTFKNGITITKNLFSGLFLQASKDFDVLVAKMAKGFNNLKSGKAWSTGFEDIDKELSIKYDAKIEKTKDNILKATRNLKEQNKTVAKVTNDIAKKISQGSAKGVTETNKQIEDSKAVKIVSTAKAKILANQKKTETTGSNLLVGSNTGITIPPIEIKTDTTKTEELLTNIDESTATLAEQATSSEKIQLSRDFGRDFLGSSGYSTLQDTFNKRGLLTSDVTKTEKSTTGSKVINNNIGSVNVTDNTAATSLARTLDIAL